MEMFTHRGFGLRERDAVSLLELPWRRGSITWGHRENVTTCAPRSEASGETDLRTLGLRSLTSRTERNLTRGTLLCSELGPLFPGRKARLPVQETRVQSPGEGRGYPFLPVFLPGEFHRGVWQATRSCGHTVRQDFSTEQ